MTPGALLDGKAAPLEGFAAVLSRPTQRALIITNCLSIYKREQQRGARLGQLWLSPCTTGLFVPAVLLGTWPPCPCAWEKALPWPVSFGETHYFFNFFFFFFSHWQSSEGVGVHLGGWDLRKMTEAPLSPRCVPLAANIGPSGPPRLLASQQLAGLDGEAGEPFLFPLLAEGGLRLHLPPPRSGLALLLRSGHALSKQKPWR